MRPTPVAVRHDVSILTSTDLHLFNEGTHSRLYEKLGSRPHRVDGVDGVYFAVWAPNAEFVAVMGDFNGWHVSSHPLRARENSGIWEGFIPEIPTGARYKYFVSSRHLGYKIDKIDPFAYSFEVPPLTASRVWALDYTWRDGVWMEDRKNKQRHQDPMSIYEVHLGSWMRVPEEGNRHLTYREMAPRLAAYVKKMGFTHVELLPIMEHPFYGSWGYQTTGYFAPTSRYGSPQDFMFLVDTLHQEGIGVILDWVPSHFPTDGHGLGYFDGTHLFEHMDPRLGFHPDWKSFVFNYDRHEVRSFLLSSAMFWLDKYHVDGLRVDAVASMLYLDYSRQNGDWIPNIHGGRENLAAISFIQKLNEEIYEHYPDVQTIAEESTAWAAVSRPTYVGGLGFGFKWDMGWMHDTLVYITRDTVHRRYHQSELTFRMLYAFHENFILPLSHDEVTHGKGALLSKMPGDDWQKFANLRLLYGYMYAQPGKKLLFMGGEFGQWNEWDHESSLDWHLTAYDRHQGIQQLIRDLNLVYRTQSALHTTDTDHRGFEWVDASDTDNSVLSFIRKGEGESKSILVVLNLTPVPRMDYRIGVPTRGYWKEIINTDAHEYGGSGLGNSGGQTSDERGEHGRPFSLVLTLPPLSVVFFESPST